MARIVDRMAVASHRWTAPLQWDGPADGPTIDVHATVVVAAERKDDDLPVLCWFQGGPGFESDRPEARSGWMAAVLERFRLVLIDQRGTGCSSPFDAVRAGAQAPAEVVEHLRNLRADAIVRDAEMVREQLLGPEGRWLIGGQSFGGFCALTYLSFAPEHLDGVVITGGFAPVARDVDEVYPALLERMVERNERYLRSYPEDGQRLRSLVDHVRDAAGSSITPRQLLGLGIHLGRTHGAEHVHSVLERAAYELEAFGTLSAWVHDRTADVLRFGTNPLYALLHEAIYCQGRAARWAAARAIDSDPRFSLDADVPLLTGEVVLPEVIDVLPGLRELRPVADALAAVDDWPPLYDLDQLRASTVPVVGTIYYDDLYVDRGAALETAALLGNCEVWITNEYEHGGYRADPTRVFGRLFAMLDERAAVGRR